jgi:hypothetical protein
MVSMAIPEDVQERAVAEIEGDFVVFRIGIRVHKLWQLHKWVPIFSQMTDMINELEESDSGLLGVDGKLGIRNHEMIQYWRSVEDIEQYALNPDSEHYPAWQEYLNDPSDAIGIWHETYHVEAGQYETAYRNMPPQGLGEAAKRVAAPERQQTGTERIGSASEGEVTADADD